VRGNISSQLSYTGDVNAKNTVSIIPRVSARITQVNVGIGDEVKTGDVIAVLDQASLVAALQQAQGGLISSQARLDALNNPRAEDISIARGNLVAAQDRLDRIVNPPAAEVDVLKANVAKAEAALKAAQSAYDKIAFAPDAGARPEAVALESATNDYNIALSNLNNKVKPAQQDIDVARQSVDQADQSLRKALQPNTDTDVAAAKGAVVQSQGGVSAAQINVNEATVKAPIDGIVSTVPSPVGSTTSTASPIVTLVSKEVEVVIPIEETHLSDVKSGSRAILNVAAYPGEDIPGVVASVAPTVDPRSRTAQVRVEPTTQDGRLKPGMFAQVRIVTQDVQGVITVPKEAVVQRNGQNVVFTVNNGLAKQVPVEVGASDDKNVEIKSGVDQGVPVIITGLATLRDGDPVTVARPGGAGGAGGAQGGGAAGGAQGGGAAGGTGGAAGGAQGGGAAGGAQGGQGGARPGGAGGAGGAAGGQGGGAAGGQGGGAAGGAAPSATPSAQSGGASGGQ
jgi:RND family efflux transporter MFP subunit